MRVVMEVVAGPLAGRRFHLVRNQRLEVGSTSWADVCIRGDNLLAPQQFALETDHLVCRVRDLAQQANTLVNGQPVEAAIVRDGDEIRAGNSRFMIHVEGDTQEAPGEAIVPVSGKATAVAKIKKAGTATYKTVVCDTGLTRYEADATQCSPADLMTALAAEFPLYMLADNRRLKDPQLAELPTPHYLFDWLGESAPALSPLILHPGEIDDPAGLLARAWRRDGIVCFFAKEEKDDIAQQLRASAQAGDDRVMGICWPTILAYLFSHFQPDFIKRLMAPFACALVEDATKNDFWQLYAAEPLDGYLESLGMKSADKNE